MAFKCGLGTIMNSAFIVFDRSSAEASQFGTRGHVPGHLLCNHSITASPHRHHSLRAMGRCEARGNHRPQGPQRRNVVLLSSPAAKKTSTRRLGIVAVHPNRNPSTRISSLVHSKGKKQSI